jgi:hypothetical protein
MGEPSPVIGLNGLPIPRPIPSEIKRRQHMAERSRKQKERIQQNRIGNFNRASALQGPINDDTF